jgi:peptide/nickel transport system ATP-binding protein
VSGTQAEMRGGAEPLVQVEGLRTSFATERGLVRAVDGVDLTISRGRSLGIVGESGSGKTVLSRSIMGYSPPPRSGLGRCATTATSSSG